MHENTDHLKPFGYIGLFSSRNNLDEVWNWINQLSDGEKIAASTAAGMAVNTLLRVLDQRGMLRKSDPTARRMVIVLEEGVYQTTIANFDCDGIELAYLEYEKNGDPDEMVAIPQSKDDVAMAYASIRSPITQESVDTLNIDQVFQAILQENHDGLV